MTGTVSRTARVSSARRNLKEAVRKVPGPMHKNRIRGSHVWARGRIDSKPDSHLEGMEVYAAGIWDEGGCALPGEVCRLARRGLAERRRSATTGRSQQRA